ncbi:hypothetical protein [Gilliamella apicola]|uniref:hypothetical protein n=1 Tax=Gilliamella apicola TaxID=1196095 RepID=UPI0015E8CEFC|nr:hypothetical protein [Gilliamella apicola]
MSGSFENHRQFRTFNVIDDVNHQTLSIDIAVSLSVDRVLPIIRQTSSISRLFI